MGQRCDLARNSGRSSALSTSRGARHGPVASTVSEFRGILSTDFGVHMIRKPRLRTCWQRPEYINHRLVYNINTQRTEVLLSDI